MSHKIAIVAATEREIEPILNYLKDRAEKQSFQTFQLHGLLVDIIYSGIGILQTTYTLMEYLAHRHPDGWIQCGIGGAFNPEFQIGEVYGIQKEMLVGFGAENQEGHVLSQFELNWNDPDVFPYVNGWLDCPYQTSHPLAMVSGMTTFHANGQQEHIDLLRQQQHGEIENMEGASFFFISLVKRIPFLSIRSISNKVESRNTSNWNIDLAIEKLNEVLIKMLEVSKFNPDKLFRALHV